MLNVATFILGPAIFCFVLLPLSGNKNGSKITNENMKAMTINAFRKYTRQIPDNNKKDIDIGKNNAFIKNSTGEYKSELSRKLSNIIAIITITIEKIIDCCCLDTI